MSVSLAVRGSRVVVPSGLTAAAILVNDGRIVDILPPTQIPAGVQTIEAGDAVVMPGVVDTHVHINDPGRTEWEGFDTATRAAAAGGVTTVVDMPLNSVPATTDVDAVKAKQAAAEGRLWVDCALWGGVVPGNADQLEALVEVGVVGFKAFLVPSGIPEFSHVGESDLREAMPHVARLGAPLLVHAELASPGSLGVVSSTSRLLVTQVASPAARQPVRAHPADPRDYATYLASRPDRWETDAVRLMIDLCRETGCHVHIVHVSSSDVLPLLIDARREGLPVTAETCPHYLAIAAEEIPQGATEFKCSPPIRGRTNRDRLWQALQDGVLDLVASDHSPSTPALKCRDTGNFLDAWGGIASLQVALPVVWTQARARGIAVTDIVRWMSSAPARLCGLDQRKGQLAKGFDADLVIWDPDDTFQVESSSLFHRHSLTPYLGRTLNGVVKMTMVRGEVVYERGRFPGTPIGRPVGRAKALHHRESRDAMPSGSLTRLNILAPEKAKMELLRCCGSARWAEAMVTRRPFIDEAHLTNAAREVWFGLEREDWLEAFGHHPRIGEREALRAKFATTRAWAENEQAGTNSASEAVLDALAGANQAYEERFGYIFIVCATGISAEEMLEKLKRRLENAADVEITVAAEEQAKITRIRLQKLIDALGESRGTIGCVAPPV